MTRYAFDERAEQTLRSLEWLQDDQQEVRGTGRTTLLAASAILRALQRPNEWVRFAEIEAARDAPTQVPFMVRVLVQRVFGGDAAQFSITRTNILWTCPSPPTRPPMELRLPEALRYTRQNIFWTSPRPAAGRLMEMRLREALGYTRQLPEVVQCLSARQRVVVWLLEEQPVVYRSLVDPETPIPQSSSWFAALLERLSVDETAQLAATLERYLTSIIATGGHARVASMLTELDPQLARWYAFQIPLTKGDDPDADELLKFQAALRTVKNIAEGLATLTKASTSEVAL